MVDLPPPPSDAPVATPSRKRSRKPWIVGIAALVVAGIAAFALTRGGGGDAGGAESSPKQLATLEEAGRRLRTIGRP